MIKLLISVVSKIANNVRKKFLRSSCILFSEVLWNGILGDEKERGPDLSNIINGK